MLIVLSPSKSLNLEECSYKFDAGTPEFLTETKQLVKELKTYTPAKLAKLMSISSKLADLNVERYRTFKAPFTPDNSKPALLSFTGDVYQGIRSDEYTKRDFTFADRHLRILSGLYGLLKPTDLMQPYRLEMGCPLKNPKGKTLYDFWGRKNCSFT